MTVNRRVVFENLLDIIQLTVGVLLQAAALRLFLAPARLATGGISGLAQIVNSYTAWPIGLMVAVGNVPLFLLGWRYLGGRRFALRTVYAVLMYSILVELLVFLLPQGGVTGDVVLNTMFGGVISGIGYGFVYRGRGTSGGSDILARILSHWRGISVSQSYLLTDALVIFLAGLAFSWELALYALVALYISGIAAETILEGVSAVRTAMIVTNHPDQVSEQILTQMERGVTVLPAVGAYTGESRSLLYCVISRSEVASLKALVHEVDKNAFMVIGQAHEALGEGFQRWGH